jgi:hypothetical protein
MWQQLIEILDKLCKVYDDLANLGEKKRDALVVVDMDGLSKLLDQEQIITSKIQKLENQRCEIFLDFAKNNSAVNSELNAEEFYKTAPTPYLIKKLMELHKQLTVNVERTLKIRETNLILAQTALDTVTFKLNRLGGAFVEPTYGTKGNIVTHQKKFDYNA